MNQVYKTSIFLLLIFISVSCDIQTADNKHRKLSTEDLKSILDGINILENEDYRIFISVDRYLNDSTFIITVNQHSVEISEINELQQFKYKGMDTFFNTKHYGSWVPDSYYKQILITVFECSFQYHEHKLLGSEYLYNNKCEIDTTDTFDINDIP